MNPYIGDRQLDPDEEDECELTWEEIQKKRFDDYDPPDPDFS